MSEVSLVILNPKRPACPFYGFHQALGMLVDQGGNQCALITTSYSPCQMEIGEQVPNWNVCPLNQKNLDSLKVFPKEFSGPIPFPEWESRVML